MSSAPAAARGPVRLLDVVVGIALAVIAAGVGLVLLGLVGQFTAAVGTACEGVTPAGTSCSPGYIAGIGALGTAIMVFGWALPTGFLIVRIVRRRLSFWLPILSMAVMISGFYLFAALLGQAQPPL